MHIPNNEYQRILELLPIVCVDCVITYKNQCLLLKRDNQPARGQWWFPGGRVLKNESLQEAASRKALEETCLATRFVNFISIEETMFPQLSDMKTDIHTVNICCHLSTSDISNLKIDSYHEEYLWVDLGTAKSLSLHDSVLQPLLNALG